MKLGKEFGEEIVAAVKGYFAREVAPLLARLDALEWRFAELPAPLPGRDGRDVDPHVVLTMVQAEAAKEVAKLPVPRDGRDGLGFDDMTFEQDGERSGVLRFARGDAVKEFRLSLPAIIDRGVWSDGAAYEKGDAATWAGSLWIAQRDGAAGKPDAVGGAWRLAAKRGRDGRDASAEARTPPATVRSAALPTATAAKGGGQGP